MRSSDVSVQVRVQVPVLVIVLFVITCLWYIRYCKRLALLVLATGEPHTEEEPVCCRRGTSLALFCVVHHKYLIQQQNTCYHLNLLTHQ